MLTDAGPTVVRGACHHDCPDTCVWDVTVTDGRAVRLRGNAEHPTTCGELCPKVNRFLDRVYDPDRVLRPLRRVGPKGAGSFEPISWSRAIDEVAQGLRRAIDTHGAEAVLPYSFDGTQGVIQKGVMADRFFAALGATRLRRHLCGTTATMGAADVTGIPFGIDPEDLRHARTILLWGTNTRLTNRHLWPVISEARAAGALIVAVDPVRTMTAADVDLHVQIRPGTDVALVLAMIHVIDRDGLVEADFVDSTTSGWPELRASASAMPPDAAAAITGIAPERIEWLARTFATRRPAAIRVLVGPEHRHHGREIFRALTMLPSVTGAWRDRGGGLARSTQVYFESAIAHPDLPAGPAARSVNMSALGATLTDRSLDPPVAALVVHNCNPAVITPDQTAVLAGLARDDLFCVVLEQFMTDTARYADIVLPATTQVEHLDLMIAWGHLYMALNRPAIPPVGEALPNTEIFRRLAAAMGMASPPFHDSDEQLVRQVLASDHAWLRGISYEGLVRTGWARLAVPDGFRPYVDAPARTTDGRLHLGALECRPGPETPGGDTALAARFPLTLMSLKQHPTFLNSSYGGSERHRPHAGEPRLEVHADDAAPRGIRDGEPVRVFNGRGSLEVRARISERVQPGLVAMPFGWWASRSPGGRTVNALTNPDVNGTQGSAAFHETLVEVERSDSSAPAARTEQPGAARSRYQRDRPDPRSTRDDAGSGR